MSIPIVIALYPDSAFREKQKRIRQEAELRKCRCWIDFDRLRGDTVRLILGKSHLELIYPAAGTEVSLAAAYGDILAVTEYSDGILIRLNHGRMLFLPVTKDGAENENLMQALILLTERCRCVYRISSMRLKGISLSARFRFAFRPRSGIYLGDGYTNFTLTALIVLSVFIATVFVSMIFRTTDISAQEAVSVTGQYESYRAAHARHSVRYVDLIFSDGQRYTVDGCCANSKLLETLKNLPSGSEMELLLHPVTEGVLEIRTEGETPLVFSTALPSLRREAGGFFALGLFLYLGSGYLFWGMVRKKL